MPTPYKGKLRITCGREVCDRDRVRADATVACFGCADAVCEILDLDDKVLLAFVEPSIELRADPETSQALSEETITEKPETVAKKGREKR